MQISLLLLLPLPALEKEQKKILPIFNWSTMPSVKHIQVCQNSNTEICICSYINLFMQFYPSFFSMSDLR